MTIKFGDYFLYYYGGCEITEECDNTRIKDKTELIFLFTVKDYIALSQLSCCTNNYSLGKIKIWRCCTTQRAPIAENSSDVSGGMVC